MKLTDADYQTTLADIALRQGDVNMYTFLLTSPHFKIYFGSVLPLQSFVGCTI